MRALALPGAEQLVHLVLDLLHLDGRDGGQLELAHDGEARGGVRVGPVGRYTDAHC